MKAESANWTSAGNNSNSFALTEHTLWTICCIFWNYRCGYPCCSRQLVYKLFCRTTFLQFVFGCRCLVYNFFFGKLSVWKRFLQAVVLEFFFVMWFCKTCLQIIVPDHFCEILQILGADFCLQIFFLNNFDVVPDNFFASDHSGSNFAYYRFKYNHISWPTYCIFCKLAFWAFFFQLIWKLLFWTTFWWSFQTFFFVCDLSGQVLG